MRFSVAIALAIFFVSAGAADPPHTRLDIETADELIHCMAVFWWGAQAEDPQKRADYKQWIITYNLAAKDLTSDEYVRLKTQKESANFNRKVFGISDVANRTAMLDAEVNRCIHADFEPKYVARLKDLIAIKKEENSGAKASKESSATGK